MFFVFFGWILDDNSESVFEARDPKESKLYDGLTKLMGVNLHWGVLTN